MINWKTYIDIPVVALTWGATWGVWSTNLDYGLKTVTAVFGAVYIIFKAMNEITKYLKGRKK